MSTLTTLDVANRLVELCREHKGREAIVELYADDAVSIEAMDGGPFGREISGKDAILKASDGFDAMTEIHGGDVDGPYPHDDEFIVFMSLECTFTEGPMAGQRVRMKEACHYTVQDGKIARSKFFYVADEPC